MTVPATAVVVPAMTMRKVTVERPRTGSENVAVYGPVIEPLLVGVTAVTVGATESLTKRLTDDVATTLPPPSTTRTRQYQVPWG